MPGVQLSLALLASGESDSGDPLDWLRNAVPGEPGVDYPILASIQVPSAVLILIFMASTIISFSSWLPYNRPLFGRWCPITVSISRGPAITDQFEFNLSTSYPGDEFHLRRPCDGRLLCRSRAGLPGLPRLPSGPKLDWEICQQIFCRTPT